MVAELVAILSQDTIKLSNHISVTFIQAFKQKARVGVLLLL
jgi:hypothetical protein